MPLKLVRRHGAVNWYLRGTVRGIRVDESAGTPDKKKAEEIRVKREAQLLEESIHGRAVTMTFAQAALDYLEKGGNRRFLDKPLAHFGTILLSRIDQSAIENGALKMYPKAKAATRNRQFFTPTSAVLHHAAKRGWCAAPVIERPEQPEGRIRWIEIDEANRLIDACGPAFRPLMVFLLYTGARAGEAVWLDWRHVDLERRHVNFVDTKNGESRGVPLAERVVEELRKSNRREGPVFLTRRGQPYKPHDPEDDYNTSAGNRIRNVFQKACDNAGITNFRPHDCRHTWATWHYRANRDLGALQKLGGWKTLSMVMRYAHTNTAEHAHTIDSLPGAKSGEVLNFKSKSA